ncbi:hypothetical protein C8F01DRAFT_1302616 [Mycena amicta]|nr:hypothetical protein C8F01DRAFT_1302616 [Mycena amicta]
MSLPPMRSRSSDPLVAERLQARPVSWLPASRFVKSAGARCSFVTKTINCNQTAVTSLPPLNITQSSSNAFKVPISLSANSRYRCLIFAPNAMHEYPSSYVFIVLQNSRLLIGQIAHQQSLPLPLVRNGAEFEDHLYALEEIKQVVDGVCRKHRVSGLPKKWNAKWSEVDGRYRSRRDVGVGSGRRAGGRRAGVGKEIGRVMNVTRTMAMMAAAVDKGTLTKGTAATETTKSVMDLKKDFKQKDFKCHQKYTILEASRVLTSMRNAPLQEFGPSCYLRSFCADPWREMVPAARPDYARTSAHAGELREKLYVRRFQRHNQPTSFATFETPMHGIDGEIDGAGVNGDVEALALREQMERANQFTAQRTVRGAQSIGGPPIDTTRLTVLCVGGTGWEVDRDDRIWIRVGEGKHLVQYRVYDVRREFVWCRPMGLQTVWGFTPLLRLIDGEESAPMKKFHVRLSVALVNQRLIHDLRRRAPDNRKRRNGHTQLHRRRILRYASILENVSSWQRVALVDCDSKRKALTTPLHRVLGLGYLSAVSLAPQIHIRSIDSTDPASRRYFAAKQGGWWVPLLSLQMTTDGERKV